MCCLIPVVANKAYNNAFPFSSGEENNMYNFCCRVFSRSKFFYRLSPRLPTRKKISRNKTKKKAKGGSLGRSTGLALPCLALPLLALPLGLAYLGGKRLKPREENEGIYTFSGAVALRNNFITVKLSRSQNVISKSSKISPRKNLK